MLKRMRRQNETYLAGEKVKANDSGQAFGAAIKLYGLENISHIPDKVQPYFPDIHRLPDYTKGNDPDFPGINVYRVDIVRGYCLPWKGIYVPREASMAYIQHEYGHYLQYRLRGWNYYAKVMAQSGWSVISGNSNTKHLRIPVELEATTMAHEFFGRNSKLNTLVYPTYAMENALYS
jgi:hypothetical protein